MAKYVSYYDESNFDSWVEVMNMQNDEAAYKITAYDRDGSINWEDPSRMLTRFETERISIREYIENRGHKEGLIVIEPLRRGNEFPAMLTIRPESRTYKYNQFVPFIRVP